MRKICTGSSNVCRVQDQLCRGSDVYEDPSAWQGEEIFELLKSGDLKGLSHKMDLAVDDMYG
jgi:hypothetical protein